MLHLTALLIERTVPGVRKTVKWNSAFYGVKGGDWFLGMHRFTNYVEAAFFRGTFAATGPAGRVDVTPAAELLPVHKSRRIDSRRRGAHVPPPVRFP